MERGISVVNYDTPLGELDCPLLLPQRHHEALVLYGDIC